MKAASFSNFALLTALPSTMGYAFVNSSSRSSLSPSCVPTNRYASRTYRSSSLKMIDQNVLQGAAIALAGLGAGVGLVAFTETQGERAKARGSGISEGMSARIAGSLMEDVEVDSVSDLGSLTAQLESALKDSGGVDDKKMSELELTEEEKKKIAEDADDGW